MNFIGRNEFRNFLFCATVLALNLGCSSSTNTFNPLSVTLDLKRGPYVQLADTESITIVWQTYSVSQGAVEFGPSGSLGMRKESGSSGTTHAITLTGLRPNTYYFYRVFNGRRPLSKVLQFHTSQAADEEQFSFLVFGDSGTPDFNTYRIGQLVNESSASLAIHTGDVVYPHGEEENYDSSFFYPFAEFLSTNVLYPSLGNHDAEANDGAPYISNFYLPMNNPVATERYYSFDYGHAHFVALDTQQSTTPGSEQFSWLEEDLASNTKPWTFVYFHKPPYTAGYYDLAGKRFYLADTSVRANLVPLFELYGVTIVFSGHSHSYERTFPLLADQPVDQYQEPDYANPAGPIYIVTGGGGGSLLGLDLSPLNVQSELTHHIVEITLARNELRGRTIGLQGSIVDEFRISQQ